MPIAPQLRQLVLEAWSEYASHGRTEYVVHPSVPILFFGDREAYENSALRVITAALNPSRTEFPDDNRFRRFRRAQGVAADLLDDGQIERYLGGLGAYYQAEPYRRWFAALEPILQGMGASFYSGRDAIALHTDICSPLATDPTWSRLSDAARAALSEPGRRIWHSLVDYLQRPLDITAVILNLLSALQDRWQQLGLTGFPPQAPQFRRRCILDGRTIQVSTGTRLLTGRCLGIDDSGSLVLQTESGREEVASGSVVKME